MSAIRYTVIDKDNTTFFLREYQGNVKTALYAVGNFVVGEAKVRTPIDTGYLVSRNNFEVDMIDKVTQIYNDAHYASYVEDGTFRQEAQPFFKPAVQENVYQITQIFVRYLR